VAALLAGTVALAAGSAVAAAPAHAATPVCQVTGTARWAPRWSPTTSATRRRSARVSKPTCARSPSAAHRATRQSVSLLGRLAI